MQILDGAVLGEFGPSPLGLPGYEITYLEQPDAFYDYEGPGDELILEWQGPPLVDFTDPIQTAVSGWRMTHGLTPIYLLIENNPQTNRWRVRHISHGSPAIPVIVMVGLFVAVIVLGLSMVYWRVNEVYWGAQQKKMEVLAKLPQEEVVALAQEHPEIFDLGQAPSPFGDIGNIVKWGAVGLGALLAVQVVTSFRR